MALPELDPAIHAPARLQIMTTLCAIDRGDRVAFPKLQEHLGLSAGNLSTHLRKLEDAGYVDVEKSFRGRVPITWIQVSQLGRDAFGAYLEALQTYLNPVALEVEP